jgi:hypothetical protein
VPALATLAYKSPVERALVSLQEIASALPEPSTAASASAPPLQPQHQPTAGGSSLTSNDPSGAGSFNATIPSGDQVHDDNCADLEAPRDSDARAADEAEELTEPEPQRELPPTGSKMGTSNEEQEQEENDVALLPDPTGDKQDFTTTSRTTTDDTSLIRELQQLKMRDLRKRAVSMGVAMEEVEEARDSDSPKKNLIALIVTRAAAAAGSPVGARP